MRLFVVATQGLGKRCHTRTYFEKSSSNLPLDTFNVECLLLLESASSSYFSASVCMLLLAVLKSEFCRFSLSTTLFWQVLFVWVPVNCQVCSVNPPFLIRLMEAVDSIQYFIEIITIPKHLRQNEVVHSW